MLKLSHALAGLTALSLSAIPLYAQESQPAQEPAQEAAPQAPAQNAAPQDAPTAIPPSLGLDTGADTSGIGQPYVRESHGDWQLQCVRAEEGEEEPCQLYQLLDDDEGNSVAEISLFKTPEGGEAVAGATVVVPLETLLPAGLLIAVDSAAPKRYNFAFCNQVGCFARIGLTQSDINAFRNGQKATVTIRPVAAPDVEVALDMSLIGFTAGLAEVSTIAQ